MTWVGSAHAAEEPSLEELLRTEVKGSRDILVSTAGRLAQSAELAPGVTHVVTRREIERLGLRRFTDILRRLPGFHAIDGTVFSRVNVRGIGPGDFNGRVLFLLDGVRLNENIYDAGQIDLDFPVDVSLIERVEFTPGPGSALYGGNALLGVVNVISQRADRLAGPQLHAGFAPNGQRLGRLSWAQRLDDGAEWSAAFSFDRTPQPAQVISGLLPFAAEAAPFERDGARRLSLAWRQGGFSARAFGVDRVRDVPWYLSEQDTFSSGSDQTFIRILQTAWEGRLGTQWDVQTALTVQQLRYRFDNPVDQPADAAPLTERFEALGRWAILEARAGRDWGEDHALLVGLEWQRDLLQRFRFQFLGEPPLDERADDRRLGLFVQDEWRLGARQRWVSGLRLDRRAGGPWRVSPRLAYTWSAAPGHSIKLTWGRAFRSPNRFEVSSNEVLEQAQPRSESTRALEAAWERPLSEAWQWRASVYRLALREPITRSEQGSFANRDGQHAHGLDVGLTGRGAGGWELQLDASLVRVRERAGGRVPVVPGAMLKWQLGLPLPWVEAWQLSLHGWAQSRRSAEPGAAELPGYAVFNAHLLWQPSSRWQAYLGAQNLGGRQWFEPSSDGSGVNPFVQSGTRWQAGFTWRP